MTGPVLDIDLGESKTLEALRSHLAERVEAGMPTAERSDTRQRILEVAVDLFARRGFEACSVRDLAAAVGIKAPGIYSHFRSKEEILSEAVLRALGGFIGAVTAPAEASDPCAELQNTIYRHVEYQLEHLKLARANDLLLNSESTGRYLPAGDHQLLLDVQRAYYRLVRARVQAVVGPEFGIDVTVVTFAIITLCDGVTAWYRPGGRLDHLAVAEQHWLIVRGMLGLSCD
ncbi:TetR/AcrR family transcriptional regulator [Rhodococcus wratislaviensis]|uniref:TetR/AcrR family transcriptional regulator n=1 Tax=Rhodococcus wratislaviensis TaxID=44752 RepID=UPI00366573A6